MKKFFTISVATTAIGFVSSVSAADSTSTPAPLASASASASPRSTAAHSPIATQITAPPAGSPLAPTGSPRYRGKFESQALKFQPRQVVPMASASPSPSAATASSPNATATASTSPAGNSTRQEMKEQKRKEKREMKRELDKLNSVSPATAL